MSVKQQISRELRRGRTKTRGRTTSDPYLHSIDPANKLYTTWVVDVDTGANRILKRVPIKANNRGRGYARRCSPVFLERDARGRWQVIGPGDRVPQSGTKTLLNRATGATTPIADGVGFVVAPVDYLDHWQENLGGFSRFELQTHDYPGVKVIDPDGNEVT